MPWARLHAIKDYLDMVETLAAYPDLHQTFNLVPSLVEQLEDYASGQFIDTYWELTLKPANELSPKERAFLVERMCERSDHPRARTHPRYLELARKREAYSAGSWEDCAAAFTVDELRDLQVWFTLAWFDPQTLAIDPLAALVSRGRGFVEDDKQVLADVQAGILSRTLPAYKEAAARGQIEVSTSPYFHPILPLLVNSDSARIGAPETILPSRRFAHWEDAAEHIQRALEKHVQVFGDPPKGMWCSEQAVGEDAILLLIDAGLQWSISDEAVLARSLSGAAPARGRRLAEPAPTVPPPGWRPETGAYAAYRLIRENGEMAIVFRDHTLSDLIGFAYQSWTSREAATDLLRRLRDLRNGPASSPAALVTIALDGENAWEYYPKDGRDFLQYLYEGLSADPSLQCVTVSEHLRQSPPAQPLGWLHTGSWIGADLRTWSGDQAHNVAWDLLHDARDTAAAHRHKSGAAILGAVSRSGSGDPDPPGGTGRPDPPGGALCPASDPAFNSPAEVAWRHVLVAEGSDWFWWFGDHHRTELDYVWDLDFRTRLQEIYRILGEAAPSDLFLPILEPAPTARATPPQGPISPVIDGLLGDGEEWQAAGSLAADLPSTMQRSDETKIDQVRFGWQGQRLCLLVVPAAPGRLEGLEVEVRLLRPGLEEDAIIRLTLEEQGRVGVTWVRQTAGGQTVEPIEPAATEASWNEVLEAAVPVDAGALGTAPTGLVIRVGRAGMTERVFHSAGLTSIGWGGQ